ncbi:retrovirus-related Pol polyprotein from transposon TNT 1-94 isoform X1 [Gossypium australe]|uniref:Retrovirus-related Pol polyprotein from transposon TNT 1-94 isoform X1 n=1 Tax=Gossypium australe TaxID=47621 RepID=A0A5B6WUU8_9ROSI|nr:retrovirus-related Pol polyprotein from transposon TNT 1-94 isoform X1 [Gossypium australe]
MWGNIRQRFSIGNGLRVQQLRCNLTIELEKKRGEERVHKLFISLDEEHYGTVRTNILSIYLLPNLNRVYVMVLK